MKWIGKIIPWLGLTLFGLSIFFLKQQLKVINSQEVFHQISLVKPVSFAISIAFSLLSYCVLACIERLSLKYAKHSEIPIKISTLASFVANVVSHNIGLSLLSGAPIRYRFYSLFGLGPKDIAKIVGFNTISFWLGLASLGGISILKTGQQLGIPHSHYIGIFLISLVFFYIVSVVLFYSKTFRFFGWKVSFPHPLLAILQLFYSCIDWILVATCLYVLLPSQLSINLLHFCAVFLAAQLVGMISQIPGGLGVFESILILGLNQFSLNHEIIASVLIFRFCYYLIPLSLAFLVYIKHEITNQRRIIKLVFTWAGAAYFGMVPVFFSVSVFICGIILLFSGATPTLSARLILLERFLPLPVFEISHLAGSVIGVFLIVLSRGLARRLDLAWILTIFLLIAGIFACLFKGADFEESIVLAIQLGALLPCRKIFFRRSKAIEKLIDLKPATLAFFLAFGLTLTFLVGYLSHGIPSSNSQDWFDFSFHSHAPRFLRTTLVLALITVAILLWESLSFSKSRKTFATISNAELKAAIHNSPSPHGWLAMTQDKLFFPSDSKQSFIMYRVQGKSWIAMGDPVGLSNEIPDLLWEFFEAAQRQGCKVVFYQVQLSNAQLYIDLGLILTKIGEEAIIPIQNFTLEGVRRKDFRRALRQGEAVGWQFDIVAAEDILKIISDLKTVSDQWLKKVKSKEKSFSVGKFDETYLQMFPCARVADKSGKIIAFANIWTQLNKFELSVDLMRYTEDAPKGLMDYLLVQVILWGKKEGYTQFNLGMAPLSGIESRPFAPKWNKFASFLYKNSKRFFNFSGLRAYKEKYEPQWRPIYLASHGGVAFPKVLIDLTLLINTGKKGIN